MHLYVSVGQGDIMVLKYALGYYGSYVSIMISKCMDHNTYSDGSKWKRDRAK